MIDQGEWLMCLLSVIIPSFNSRKTIVQCLESVFCQSYSGSYHVIVVDSSDDGTDRIVKKYFPMVSLIHLENKTLPGSARNMGTRYAFSKYIAFTDTDCIVDYYWIEKFTNRMKESHYDAVCGAILNGTPNSITGCLGYLNEFSFFMPGIKPGLVSAAATANICYNREIFQKQRFIETNFAGEDTIFHWMMLRNGGNLFFDPEIKVTHLNRTGFKNVLSHQLKMGKGAGFSRVVMKRDIIFIKFPIACLLILPLIRLIKMYARIFTAKKDIFLRTIFAFPLSYLIAYSWSIGFYHSINYYRLNPESITPDHTLPICFHSNRGSADNLRSLWADPYARPSNFHQ